MFHHIKISKSVHFMAFWGSRISENFVFDEEIILLIFSCHESKSGIFAMIYCNLRQRGRKWLIIFFSRLERLWMNGLYHYFIHTNLYKLSNKTVLLSNYN